MIKEIFKDFFQDLICKIFGHRYIVYAKPKEKWAKGIRWLKCTRCGRDFIINDSIKAFLPMAFELQDLHEWEYLQKNTEE